MQIVKDIKRKFKVVYQIYRMSYVDCGCLCICRKLFKNISNIQNVLCITCRGWCNFYLSFISLNMSKKIWICIKIRSLDLCRWQYLFIKYTFVLYHHLRIFKLFVNSNVVTDTSRKSKNIQNRVLAPCL